MRRGLPAEWRKAPGTLAHHPTVLLAVIVAALLAALTASSAPFVTTAASSEALKDRLAELTSFATGLEVEASPQLDGGESAASLAADQTAVRAAAAPLGARLRHLAAPVYTTQTPPAVTISGRGGGTDVVLMARTAALAHVTVLSQVPGPGIWISDISAQAAGVRPGELVTVGGLESPAHQRAQRMRVEGVYRALAHEPETDYWTNLFQEIYPQCIDCGVPPPFAFVSPAQLDRLLSGSVGGLTRSVEFPIDSRGLTLQSARGLARELDALPATVAASPLGRALGCSALYPPGRCVVVSSLSAAVILANENASAVTPAVSLLSDLGASIALAVAAAAGVFGVRRRRAEAALHYARGEHVVAFAARAALEALLPTLLGGALGFAIADALTNVFAPAGSITDATLWAALGHGAVAVAAGLCLLVAASAASYLLLYDTGSRNLGRLRHVPWELALAGGAAYLLVRIRSGGGVSTSSSGAHAPTLAVFVYPLLLVGAAAGLAARAARALLRRGARGAGRLGPASYLALRRLAAARGLVVVLATLAAVSLGSLFYVETLAGSLQQTTLEKAYMATGSDASAIVQNAQLIPPGFPYPATLVQFANQSASLPDGTSVDVMLVDPATLARTLHWQSDWGPSPQRFLTALARSRSQPLPVIVTSDLAGARALVLGGVRVPLRRLAVVHAFPLMAQGIPLAITSYRALDAFQARTKVYDSLGVLATYAWGKGPPTAVGRALASLDPAYPPQTIDTFLDDPQVTLATRTFGYMRLIAIASGVLALVGLVLYLQARQRSQAIAAALARRMGLGALAQTLSLAIELCCLLAFAGLIGGVVAVAAAVPVVHRIDPLPLDPPSPIFVVPTLELVLAALSLLLVALLAAAVASWLAARADVGEALRVA